MSRTVPAAWEPLLRETLAAPYFSQLLRRVDAARAAGTVYPPEEEQFRALALTPPQAVRAVILGQDPYHGAQQANGLAFSVRAGVKLPPSLRNMMQELESDLGCAPPCGGDLSPWAEQGVLLLNTVLTVDEGRANSHKDFGWQRFTDEVISSLRALPQPIAFVLWGAQAQKKAAIAADSPYPRLILSAPHPSPLSSYRGFFGSRPYSQINRFLEAHGTAPIDFSGDKKEQI